MLQETLCRRSILLIAPPWIKEEGNIWKSVASCLPSIGLGILAAYLERSGIKVSVIDYQAERYSREDFCRRLGQIKPDFVGITATSVLINSALELARIVKEENNTPVVVGGVHATVMPGEVLSHPCVDYVIRGEGEKPLLSLLQADDPGGIDGLSFKENGHLVHVGPQAYIDNLDELPYPAYHLLPLRRYHTRLGRARQRPSMSLLAARGCPGRCTFCNSKVFGKKPRFRSPGHILGEIELLVHDYGIEEFSFYDDTFGANKKRVAELCQLLIGRRLKIAWTCMSRVDYVEPDILSLMARAGCYLICYGVESADPAILDAIKKDIDLEQVRRAVRMTQEAGMEVRLSFMLGSPGETGDSIEKTIKFAIDTAPDTVQFNVTTPYPGSEMYSWASKNNYLLTRDWSLYDLYHCVMELPTVSPREVERAYRDAHRRFYFRAAYIAKSLKRLHSLKDLRIMINGLKAIIVAGHRHRGHGSYRDNTRSGSHGQGG